jgi:hypothetical protein
LFFDYFVDFVEVYLVENIDALFFCRYISKKWFVFEVAAYRFAKKIDILGIVLVGEFMFEHVVEDDTLPAVGLAAYNCDGPETIDPQIIRNVVAVTY